MLKFNDATMAERSARLRGKSGSGPGKTGRSGMHSPPVSMAPATAIQGSVGFIKGIITCSGKTIPFMDQDPFMI